MVEIIGDYVEPSEIVIPRYTNATLPTGAVSGSLAYDTTNNKLMIYAASGWETVTSA